MTGIFKSSAKASVGEISGLKHNASSDDLVRRIEVRIIPDAENTRADVPKKLAKKSATSKESAKNAPSIDRRLSITTQSEAATPRNGTFEPVMPRGKKSSSASRSSYAEQPEKPKSKPRFEPVVPRGSASSTASRSSYVPRVTEQPETPKKVQQDPKPRKSSSSQRQTPLQQYNRLNFNSKHLGIYKPSSHRYNSKYMRMKYNQDDDWDTQSLITPIMEDPNMPFGVDLYKQMKNNLRRYTPKLKFVKKSDDTPKPTLRDANHSYRVSTSRVSTSSFTSEKTSIFEANEREDDECSLTINVLDGKTVRVKNADNQYLTGYQHSDHINPKYRFTDRLNEDTDQLFSVEHVSGNSCVLVSVMKHMGYIKPALFFSPLTRELQLRDYYPYCPKERKYFMGNAAQGQSFLFECNNYKIELPGIGISDLELVTNE